MAREVQRADRAVRRSPAPLTGEDREPPLGPRGVGMELVAGEPERESLDEVRMPDRQPHRVGAAGPRAVHADRVGERRPEDRRVVVGDVLDGRADRQVATPSDPPDVEAVLGGRLRPAREVLVEVALARGIRGEGRAPGSAARHESRARVAHRGGRTAASRSRPPRPWRWLPPDGGDDVPAVGLHLGLLVAVHQVQVELVHAGVGELAQLRDVVLDGARGRRTDPSPRRRRTRHSTSRPRRDGGSRSRSGP